MRANCFRGVNKCTVIHICLHLQHRTLELHRAVGTVLNLASDVNGFQENLGSGNANAQIVSVVNLECQGKRKRGIICDCQNRNITGSY